MSAPDRALERRVRERFAERLGEPLVRAIPAGERLAAVGVDSVDVIAVLSALEHDLAISIDDAAYAACTSIEGIARVCAGALAAGGGRPGE